MSFHKVQKKLKTKMKQEITGHRWVHSLSKTESLIKIVDWVKDQKDLLEEIELAEEEQPIAAGFFNLDRKLAAYFEESWREIGPRPVWIQNEENKFQDEL